MRRINFSYCADYNTNFNVQESTYSPITHAVLDPTTGLPSSTTTPNAEWIFVVDVRGQPKQTQLINLPDTYNGLVWDPSGSRFCVSAGIDDHVYIYKAKTPGLPNAETSFAPDPPFILLGHDSNQTSPLPTGRWGHL